MIFKKIELNKLNNQCSKEAVLSCYLREDDEYLVLKKRPALIIIPGGGYFSLADTECETVALRFLPEGFNCFTLRYSINQSYPQPHKELAVAINYIFEHKDELNLDGNIFLMGFSAGAHLAGTFAYLYHELAECLSLDPKHLCPSGLALCYPVASLIKNPHNRSKNIITGGDHNLDKKLSIEENVASNFPPTFVWATKGDTGVNPQHAINVYKALKKNNVVSELHLYGKSLNHGRVIMTFEIKNEINPFTKDELKCREWVSSFLNFIAKEFYRK